MSQLYTVVESLALDLKWVLIAILLLSIFIDIAPAVKWNPWKALFKKIGTYITNSIKTEMAGFKADVNKKIDELSNEQKTQFEQLRKEQESQAETLNSLIQDLNYKELSRLRWDITDFDTNVARGNKYPREQYRHILDEAKKFNRMVEDESNPLIVDAEDVISIRETIRRIESHYESHRQDTNAYMI